MQKKDKAANRGRNRNIRIALKGAAGDSKLRIAAKKTIGKNHDADAPAAMQLARKKNKTGIPKIEEPSIAGDAGQAAAAKKTLSEIRESELGGRVDPSQFRENISEEAMRQKYWLRTQKVAELNRMQRKLWAVTVTCAIFLFFILLLIEVGSWGGMWQKPDASQEALIEKADYLAILVFWIDLYGRFKTTADKVEFLKHNWLEIIAILPMGLFLRIGQATESMQLLRGAGSVAKIEEIAVVAPVLKGIHAAPQVEKMGRILPEIGAAISDIVVEGQKLIANYSVVTDFIMTAWKAVSNLLRLGQ